MDYIDIRKMRNDMKLLVSIDTSGKIAALRDRLIAETDGLDDMYNVKEAVYNELDPAAKRGVTEKLSAFAGELEKVIKEVAGEAEESLKDVFNTYTERMKDMKSGRGRLRRESKTTLETDAEEILSAFRLPEDENARAEYVKNGVEVNGTTFNPFVIFTEADKIARNIMEYDNSGDFETLMTAEDDARIKKSIYESIGNMQNELEDLKKLKDQQKTDNMVLSFEEVAAMGNMRRLEQRLAGYKKALELGWPAADLNAYGYLDSYIKNNAKAVKENPALNGIVELLDKPLESADERDFILRSFSNQLAAVGGRTELSIKGVLDRRLEVAVPVEAAENMSAEKKSGIFDLLYDDEGKVFEAAGPDDANVNEELNQLEDQLEQEEANEMNGQNEDHNEDHNNEDQNNEELNNEEINNEIINNANLNDREPGNEVFNIEEADKEQNGDEEKQNEENRVNEENEDDFVIENNDEKQKEEKAAEAAPEVELLEQDEYERLKNELDEKDTAVSEICDLKDELAGRSQLADREYKIFTLSDLKRKLKLCASIDDSYTPAQALKAYEDLIEEAGKLTAKLDTDPALKKLTEDQKQLLSTISEIAAENYETLKEQAGHLEADRPMKEQAENARNEADKLESDYKQYGGRVKENAQNGRITEEERKSVVPEDPERKSVVPENREQENAQPGNGEQEEFIIEENEEAAKSEEQKNRETLMNDGFVFVDNKDLGEDELFKTSEFSAEDIEEHKKEAERRKKELEKNDPDGPEPEEPEKEEKKEEPKKEEEKKEEPKKEEEKKEEEKKEEDKKEEDKKEEKKKEEKKKEEKKKEDGKKEEQPYREAKNMEGWGKEHFIYESKYSKKTDLKKLINDEKKENGQEKEKKDYKKLRLEISKGASFSIRDEDVMKKNTAIQPKK